MATTPPSWPRTTRGRLVQSTLFSPKLTETESPAYLKGENEDCNGAVENGQDGDCCGSQIKRKRARKGKATPPQSKFSKKSKERSPAQSTPKKNSKNRVRTSQTIETGDASPSPIPNLRLEQKIIAEENSLRFAGKQIHPFFSSWKLSKKYQETTEGDNSCCLVKRKDKSVNIGLIHVFEREQEHEVDEVTILSRQEVKYFQERSLSGCLCCTNQLENRLWTDKHGLEKAIEVCGNNESVKFMSEWLHSWYERGHQANKDSSGRVASIMEVSDTDYYCSKSDYDFEIKEKETILKNVLLVSGPAGSGKSAAIYACANEQGFEVFEVNTSECQNGARVKQRFGPLLECHFLARLLENNAQSQSKNIVSNAKMTTKLDNGVVEVIALNDDDNFQGDIGPSGNFVCENSSNPCKVQVMPLILFEDIDITIQGDRDLLAAIQQIAEKAKGPVILASNSLLC